MLKNRIPCQLFLYDLRGLIDIAYTQVNDILNLVLILTLFQKRSSKITPKEAFLIFLKECHRFSYKGSYRERPEISDSIPLMRELIVFFGNIFWLNLAATYQLNEILQGMFLGNPT